MPCHLHSQGDGDSRIAKAMVRCSPRRGGFGIILFIVYRQLLRAAYYNDVCYSPISALSPIRRNKEFFYLSSDITGTIPKHETFRQFHKRSTSANQFRPTGSFLGTLSHTSCYPIACALGQLSKLSPRLISTDPLHSLRNFHSQPIYLVVFKESYQITL